MSDVVERAEAALGPPAIGPIQWASIGTLVPELLAALKAARAEAQQWRDLWRQDMVNASEAMRERDDAQAENERLRQESNDRLIQAHLSGFAEGQRHV